MKKIEKKRPSRAALTGIAYPGRMIFVLPALFLMAFSRVEARPFSDETTLAAESYIVQPGRGPFMYAHLFNIEQDQEGERSLGLIFRARTTVTLRLKKPLRLPGFTTSIHLRLEGFRGAETVYALFVDRRGKTHRIPMGRADAYGFQEWQTDLRGKLAFRPQRLSEASYVDFIGWNIEPDLRQAERSTYILLRQPVFDVRPYDMRGDAL